jgi:two-component system OmpR family sensor kinase
MDMRDEIARGAALGAAAPVLILILLSWLVVGWPIDAPPARRDSNTMR